MQWLGSKLLIADKIINYFPEHDSYVEPFFGLGSVFFKKEKAKHNILNDLNNDVANLFLILQNSKKGNKLIELIKETPFLQHFKDNFLKGHVKEVGNDIERAACFVFASITSYLNIYSKTFKVSTYAHNKDHLLDKLKKMKEKLADCTILNTDAIKAVQMISTGREKNNKKTFVYCDPPYINCKQKYQTPQWTCDNLEMLIKTLKKKDFLFAISEYESKEVNELCKKNNLFINIISKANQRLTNKNTNEILITNYKI